MADYRFPFRFYKDEEERKQLEELGLDDLLVKETAYNPERLITSVSKHAYTAATEELPKMLAGEKNILGPLGKAVSDAYEDYQKNIKPYDAGDALTKLFGTDAERRKLEQRSLTLPSVEGEQVYDLDAEAMVDPSIPTVPGEGRFEIDGKILSNVPEIQEELDKLNTEEQIEKRELENIDEQINLERKRLEKVLDPGYQLKKGIDETAWWAQDSLLKGASFLFQIPHFLQGYVLGTAENIARFGAGEVGDALTKIGFGNVDLGEGWVDYDKLWLANSQWKLMSEEAESVVKSFEQLHGLKNRSTAMHIMAYTLDYMVPLNWPKGIAKGFKAMSAGINSASDFIRYYDFSPEYVMRHTATAALETEKMKPFKDRLAKATSNKDTEEIAKVNDEMNKARVELLAEGARYLKGTAGKWKRASDKWWSFRYDTRGETVMGAIPYRTKTGKLKYKNVLLTNQPTREQIAFREKWKRMNEASAVYSAGALSGTWASWHEGTELEDFAYAFGMSAVFLNPTVSMRALEMTGDFFLGTIGREIPLTRRVFGGTLGKMMDWEGGGDVGVSIPFIIAAGAKAHYKATQRDWSEFFKTSLYKRLAAWNRGNNILKVAFVDDKKKIEIMGEETDMTALDAVIALHGVNTKTMQKVAHYFESNVPPEYLESAQQLFVYTKKLEKKLQALGRGPDDQALTKFFITAEQWAGAIRSQVIETTVGQLYKDDGFRKDLFGLGSWGDEGSLLNILRIANKESSDQIEFLQKALDNLTEGDPILDEQFFDFKRGISAWVTRAKTLNEETATRLKVMSDPTGTTLNLGKELALNDILTKPLAEGGSFAVEETLGLVSKGELQIDKLGKYGTRVRDSFNNLFEMQKVSNDYAFEQALGAKGLESSPGNADTFVEALESLRESDLFELGDIIPFLKDRTRYLAFGGSRREGLTGQQSIDYAISFARYNGLADKNMQHLKGMASDISDTDSISVLTLSDDTFRTASGVEMRLPYTGKIGKEGEIDLEKTMDKMLDHSSEAQLKPEEYLRKIMSRLSGGNDQRSRGALKDFFSHEMTINDMHSIRGNFSRWSTKRQPDKSARDIHALVKALDKSFKESGSEEVLRANKKYTDWKTTWHETDIGQNATAKSSEDRAYISEKSLPDDELLDMFLKSKDPAKTKEILKRLMMDVDDVLFIRDTKKFETRKEALKHIRALEKTSDVVKQRKLRVVKIGKDEYGIVEHSPGSTTSATDIHKSMMKDMDLALGYLLYRTKGNIVSGSVQQNKIQLGKLKENGIISQKAHDDAVKFIELTDEASIKNLSEEVEKSTTLFETLLKSLKDEKLEAIDQSLGSNISKEKSSDAIFDMFVPENRASVHGLTKDRPFPLERGLFDDLQEQQNIGEFKYTGKVDENGNLIFKDLIEETELLQDPTFERLRILSLSLRERMEIERGPGNVISARDLEDDLIQNWEAKPGKERIDSVFNVFLKDIIGVKDINKITPKQKGYLKALRDILVSTAVKRSSKKINERAPALDESMKELISGAKPGTAYKTFKDSVSGYFNLSSDIDHVAFGTFLEDMWPILTRLNKMIGQEKLSDDLTNIFEALVAVRAETSTIGIREAVGLIPKGITMPAAMSRVYAGFRGVVSWKYLASEQLVREHQRHKGLLLYHLATDPEFVSQLSHVVHNRRLDRDQASNFISKVVSIMGPRLAVWNAETMEIDTNPSPYSVIKRMRAIMLHPKEKPTLQFKNKHMARMKKEQQERAKEKEIKLQRQDIGSEDFLLEENEIPSKDNVISDSFLLGE